MKLALRQWQAAAIVGALIAVTPLVSANTALWQGVSGVSATTNWSDNANWTNSPGGSPGVNGNDVVFGDGGSASSAGTINSVVDNSALSPNSLLFTNNSTAGNFHTVLIPAGVTLSNTNGLTVGINGSAASYVTTVGFTGGGTFVQNGSALTVKNATSTGSSGALPTLDLSGLSNFIYNASGGTLTVAGSGSDARGAGQLNLAGSSNSITVGTIQVGIASGNGPGSSVVDSINLGAGTNILNVNTINLGAGKINNTRLRFLGATGGLRLRGVGGTDNDRATLTFGNRNNSGTGTVNGTADFTGGHPVDIKAGTITLGQSGGSNPSSVQPYVAGLSFDAGMVDATNINIAANALGNVTGSGGLTNAGGTLLIGAGGITLVNQTAGTAAGALALSGGGSAIVMGNIRKASTAGTATIDISSASLNMAALTNTIGSAAVPVDNLTLANSTLTLPVTSDAPGAVVNNLTINGTSDIINVSTVPGTGTFPAQFAVIKYTTLNGTLDFALGTLPGTYRGYISNNVAASSVDLVITNSLAKTDVWRGNVSDNWDTTTANWLFSGSPSSFSQGDSVTFDDTLTGTANVVLATNVAPGAVGFNNSSHNYVLSGSFKITGVTPLTKQGSGSVTLTESGGDDFIGGIVVNAGTLILDNANSAISGGLTINGGTAQIGNNDASGTLPAGTVADNGALVFNRTDLVTVATGIQGTGTLTQNGSGTLALTGANAYTGNTIVNNGTLALNGAGVISNSAGIVVNNATFDVSGANQPAVLSGLTLNNGTLTVAANPGGAAVIDTASLSFSGAANHLNVSSLPPIATYPVTFTIIQAANPAIGAFNLTVGTLPTNTPPYAANVTQSADKTAVLLTITSGPVGVRSAVLWTGADVPNLNTNWSDRLNWSLPGAPTFGENVYFGPLGTQSASALSMPGGGTAALVPDNINNIVDGNTTISSLTYTNLGGTYHNTLIGSGRTLSLTNAGLAVGTLDSGTTAMQDLATLSGPHASLVVANTNANVQVWVGSGSVSGSQSTLDLSALDTFSATVSRLLVGATIGNVVNRPSGILYLARTNILSAGFQTTSSETGSTTANASIVVADCNGNAGSTSYLYLGQVNTISANVIAIGRQKASAQFLFNPLYANVAPYPSVTFQGVNSSQVSIFDVGDGVGNTGTTTLTADANLTGGMISAAVNTMNIGRASSATSGSGTTTGSLEFDAGTISVITLNVGIQPATGLKIGIGNVGVGSNTLMGAGATLAVGGNLNLGTSVGGTGAASTAGTLGITNGTALVYNLVPGANSTVNLAGGRLVLTNAIGSAPTPLGTLNLAPLGTPDNSANALSLPVRTNSAGLTVTTLNLDGLTTTTNIINVESVGPVGATPIQLPLIQYTTLNNGGGTFNVGLGTLPSGYTGHLVNDTANNAISLMLTSAIHPQPRVTGISLQSGTNLTLTGVNGFANAPYTVLGSTDVALPLTNWTNVGTGVFANDGGFSFSAPVAASQQFFMLQVP